MDHGDILKILRAAVSANLADARTALFAGIDPTLEASLPRQPTPAAQILSDLNILLAKPIPAKGAHPFAAWLRNAAEMTGPSETASVFEDALARWQAAPAPAATANRATKETGTDAATGSVAPARVFVSYRREGEEAALAGRIRNAMAAAGHDVFIDVGLDVGVDWARKIRENIAGSDFFVVLLSAASMAREMILAEVREAHRTFRRTGKPRILPVRIRYDGPLDYELDYYIGKLNYAKWGSPADDQRIVDRLLLAIERSEYPSDEDVRAEPPPSMPASEMPSPSVDPRSQSADLRFLAEPAGILPPDDSFYVRRTCDDDLEKILRSGRAHTVIIGGPLQHGKSSLLMRYIASQAQQKRVAFVDLQQFADAELATYPEFLTALAVELLAKMGIDAPEPTIQRPTSMTLFFQGTILAAARGKLALVIDEADRLIGQRYQSDFFALLRTWQNNCANPGMPAWRDLDIALVLSTHPHLLIGGAHQSPFNHGQYIQVSGFTLEECKSLARLYPRIMALRDVDTLLEDLHMHLGGHPYLTRLAFHRLAVNGVPRDELFRTESEPFGPYGDHLRALLTRLSEDPELLQGMKEIVQFGEVRNAANPTMAEGIAQRLHYFGLVVQKGGRYRPANLLYANFFKSLR